MQNFEEAPLPDDVQAAAEMTRRSFLRLTGAAVMAGVFAGFSHETLFPDPVDAHATPRLPEASSNPYAQRLIDAGYWDVRTFQQNNGLPLRRQSNNIGPITRGFIDRGEGLEFSTPHPGRVIEVDIDKQLLIYFIDGNPEIIVRISSGAEQRWTEKRADGKIMSGTGITPPGEYRVNRLEGSDYYSNIFGPTDGKMPYAIKLSRFSNGKVYPYNGIALHGGHNPGYPASHGCVRTETEAAKALQDKGIRPGDRVIIRGSAQNFRQKYL